MTTTIHQERRYDRLRRTRTLGGEGLLRWRSAVIAIVGAGVLGGRAALEIVMSGANVSIFDPDVGAVENSGTQWVQPGVAKVQTVAALANTLRPGAAAGVQADIRQIGVGQIARFDLLIDASDAPALTVPLTRLTNGLGMPMLRGALAGDGNTEMGRVQCSHGGRGHSCAMCIYAMSDLFRAVDQTPCAPAAPLPDRPPTLAGGAMGAIIAGALAISAQRLISENDIDQVLDREWILDMTGAQFLQLQRRRSNNCISGHERWELTPLALATETATLADLLQRAERHGARRVTHVQPYAHPLCVEAVCACGDRQQTIGTRWATPPICRKCGSAMTWQRASAKAALTPADIDALKIANVPLLALGLPQRGAMFTLTHDDGRTTRLVLE